MLLTFLSFQEDDDEQDTENAMPQETSKSNVKRGECNFVTISTLK